MLEKYNDVLTIKELCEAIKVGKNTAYKLLKDNTIKNIRIGRKYLIPKISVMNFLTNAAT